MLHSFSRQLKPAWMSRDIMLLLSARATMSAGRALMGVTIPIYLATIGFRGARLGLLFALSSIVSAVIAVLVGLLSDRFGRKIFVVAIPLVTALCALVMGFTQATVLIFGFATLGSLGQGQGAGGGSVGPYAPAEQALITDATPAEHRNSVFGRMAFFAALGALIGAPLAGVSDLASHFGLQGSVAYRPAFLLAVVLSAATALLALPITSPRMVRKSGRNPFSWPKHSWPFLLRFWLVIGLNGVALGFWGPFVTYWFHIRYGIGPTTIGVLYSVINILSMASNLSAARIARRLGIVRAIAGIWVVQALFLAPMVFMPTYWLAGVFYLGRQLAQRIQMPLRQSYVMGMVPQEERGAVAGLYNLPLQVASGIVPTGAGYIFDNLSIELPFELTATLQVITGLVFLACFHGQHPPDEVSRRTSAPATVSQEPMAAADSPSNSAAAEEGTSAVRSSDD